MKNNREGWELAVFICLFNLKGKHILEENKTSIDRCEGIVDKNC